MVDVEHPGFKAMFREYDLRGRVGEDELNSASVRLIANAFGRLLKRRNIDRVVVGYDNRPTSPDFKNAAITGLAAAGCDVIDIGLALSPSLYFAQHHLDVDGGLMVTASHNPNEWSGMKLAHGKSMTLGPAEMKELFALVVEGERGGASGVYREESVRDAYIDRLVEGVQLQRPLRVAIDCGNGAAGVFAWEVLSRLGCPTFQLYCDPDDSYPNYFPNPSDLAARRKLREIVTHPYINADIGLGFDGDGDRIGVLDERGVNVWSDTVLILLARGVLEAKPGARIVYDVKCSRALGEDIEAHGGVPVMWKTGHSHIKAKMHELAAELAGERSGHIFFNHGYYGFDDALFTGVRLLEALSRYDGTVSETIATLPQYVSSPEISAHCDDAVKYRVVNELVGELKEQFGERVIDINGARVEFDDGWGLVRASSNLPELVIIFEAETEERLMEIRGIFREHLARHPEIDPDWRNDIDS